MDAREAEGDHEDGVGDDAVGGHESDDEGELDEDGGGDGYCGSVDPSRPLLPRPHHHWVRGDGWGGERRV